MFGLLARALQYVTSNAPAFIASYALLDEADGFSMVGPCVVKLDGPDPPEAHELYESYAERAELDPFNAVLRKDPDAAFVTVEDAGGAEAFCNSEFGRSHLAEFGAGPSARLLFRDGSQLVGAITLRRRRDEPDFTAAQKRVLELSHDFLQAIHGISVRRARAQMCVTELARRSMLARTERHVAALAACGVSDGEIATDLSIAPGTVADHLQHIYEQLGVRTRTELSMQVLGLRSD